MGLKRANELITMGCVTVCYSDIARELLLYDRTVAFKGNTVKSQNKNSMLKWHKYSNVDKYGG